MEDTLRALNDLVASGTIERYAIGGAFGAVFYVETIYTQDLDVFCLVPADAPRLAPFAHVYEALKAHGYAFEGEHLMIAGVPVQFLPAETPLERNALGAAVKKYLGGVPAFVFRPEHLSAIALQTGRAKDYQRVELFLTEVPDLDLGLVLKLIHTYALEDRLAIFAMRYPEAAAILTAPP